MRGELGSSMTVIGPQTAKNGLKLDSRKKNEKSSKLLLTLPEAPDYIRLNNEGGAPLATKKFASKKRHLGETQESRVSDTQPAPKPKANGATTTRLRCLFFEN